MLQAAERRYGTINYTAWVGELRNGNMVQSKDVSLGPWQHGGCCSTQREISQKVTIKVTIHDLMVSLRTNGAGDRHLSQTSWLRFLKIYRQYSINGPNVGETVGFDFKKPYKLQVVVQRKTLAILKIQLLRYHLCMDLSNFEALRASSVFERFLKEMQELLTKMTSIHRGSSVGNCGSRIPKECQSNI